MQSANSDQDPHPQYFQQADPTKVIWEALQDLKLGVDRDKWTIHEDAQKEFERDHRLCLIARGLNPFHQNPAGIKIALPRIWQLVGKVEGQINDDGSVNFYFASKHHLLMVLEKQPYTYRGWIVALDRWSNMNQPTFLKKIPFKVRIYKLPNIYRRIGIVNSLASKLGKVEEVSIIEPINNRDAEVWAKILFDVDDVITLTRVVELDFRYMGLQKFCTLCGSLKHEFEMCTEASAMQQRQVELMDIGTNLTRRFNNVGKQLENMSL